MICIVGRYVHQIVAIDFLIVRTVKFRLRFVFVVLSHHRRHAIHFNVTEHPTAEWTARQSLKRFPGIVPWFSDIPAFGLTLVDFNVRYEIYKFECGVFDRP